MNRGLAPIEAVAFRPPRRSGKWSRATAAAVAIAMAGVAILPRSAAAAPPIRLQPERRATLHVNQLAVIDLVTTPPTSIIGSAGASLVLVRRRNRRDTTVLLYRAVRAGTQVFIVTPDNLPDGHCISCVTTRYFVTVVP